MEDRQNGQEQISPIDFKRAFGAVLPLCLVALMLAGLVISVANDMYAFVKPDEKITVTVDSPVSDGELAGLLKKSGVIENDIAFRLYLRSKNKLEKLSTLTGEWSLNSNMSYREIMLEIF